MIALTIGGLNAQSPSLALSSAKVAPGGTVALDFLLNASSGIPPAAMQWIFQYPSSSITRLIVDDGPALISVGKTAICAGDANVYTCMAVGFNSETIPDGIVARVTAVLAPGASAATIRISNQIGVSAGGEPISISATSGTITVSQASPGRIPRLPPGRGGGVRR